MTADDFPEGLRGAVWHTTSHTRYEQIVRSGSILAEPPIPDKERWGTACGPAMYPFVRSLGGISLFDFVDFDPATYSEAYPASQWRNFVPYSSEWRASVWLRIDTAALKEGYLSGQQVLDRWKSEKAYSRKIMPRIEAASLVSIPLSAISVALEASAEAPALTALKTAAR